MKPRTFEHFPKEKICPACGTNDDEECVLIPIWGTREGNICEGQPFHLGCAVAQYFDKKRGMIYTVLR